MRAHAISDTLLLVHLWHGHEHRLIVANFGIALDEAPLGANLAAEVRAVAWRAVLSTDDARFGGGGGSARFDGKMLSMPANTVVWLAAVAVPDDR
jgi:hypothetical protein